MRRRRSSGYTVGANGYTGWPSRDGEDWVMLDEAQEILVSGVG